MFQQLTSICDVPGIKVGLAHDDRALTGCTVIVPENGAISAVDIRGSAPGTRETDAIRPGRLVPRVDAILLTGGSAFGLAAADGVQQALEEQGRGFDVGVTTVPIVPAAVIFDLHEGDHRVRPDKEMGYRAARAASAEHPPDGRVGAGRGATVGKALGAENAMPGGQGSACARFGGAHVAALAVVNAFGNVMDPATNEIVAGARDPRTGAFVDAEEAVWEMKLPGEKFAGNTTLAVVVTDAALTKETATQVAQMAHDGFARTIQPAHTPFDGDLVFVLSVGDKQGNALCVGTAAARLVADAILKAVRAANHK